MVNPLQAVAGLALIFLLPGYFLVKAVFPRERLSEDFHGPLVLFLSVSMSLVITILVGSVLGFLPKPAGAEKGFFQGAATGFPYIELALVGVTVLLALVAAVRGAFPFLRSRRAPRAEPEPDGLEDGPLADALQHRAAAWRARRERRRSDAEREDALAQRAEREAGERQWGG